MIQFESGEKLTVFYDEQGDSACPICGSLQGVGASIPWASVNGMPGQSLAVCHACHTQFGHDDYTAMADMGIGDSIGALWMRRLAYLDQHQ